MIRKITTLAKYAEVGDEVCFTSEQNNYLIEEVDETSAGFLIHRFNGDTASSVWRPDDMIRLIKRAPPVQGDPMSITVRVGTTLAEVERLLIERTLAYLNGNKSRTALALGVSERKIYNRVTYYRGKP